MRITGIVHQKQLADHGIDRRELARWRKGGDVERVGSWYVSETAPRALVEVLRLGARPTCLDGAAAHGLWVPPGHEGVHVFQPRRASGARRRGTVDEMREGAARQLRQRESDALTASGPPSHLVHHGPMLRSWPDHDPVPELPLVLEHAARCLPTVSAAILVESALALGHMTPHSMLSLIDGLPSRPRGALARVRPDAGSGTETAVRWWLEAVQADVRSQVHVPEIGGFVDLLVGRSWVIECDSRQFHDTDDQYRRDRARDLTLRALGYTVTRLTWEQVFLQWSRTEALLLAVIRRGDHRRAPVR